MSYSTNHDLHAAYLSQDIQEFLNTPPPTLPADSTPQPEPSSQVMATPRPESSVEAMATPQPGPSNKRMSCSVVMQMVRLNRTGNNNEPESSRGAMVRPQPGASKKRISSDVRRLLWLKKTGSDDELEVDDPVLLSSTTPNLWKKPKHLVSKSKDFKPPAEGAGASIEAAGRQSYEAPSLAAPDTPASVGSGTVGTVGTVV